MFYTIALAFVGLVALAVMAHGARISRIPEREHRAGRFYMLGGALLIFTGILLALELTAT